MFSSLIENFLFRNIVNHEKVGQEAAGRFAPYKHVMNTFQKEWTSLFMMQYIVHSILKKTD